MSATAEDHPHRPLSLHPLSARNSPKKHSPPITRRGAPAAAISPCSPRSTRCSRSSSSPREDRHLRRHRLLVALSLFRQYPRRSLHPRPRRAVRRRHQPRRDDLHVFVFGGDGDGFSIGGNHLVPRRAQERPADLRHHGQLRLWPDEEADVADFAHRVQDEDRSDRRDRSADQSDQKADHRRRDLCRAAPMPRRSIT